MEKGASFNGISVIFQGSFGVHTPRVADIGCRIYDNELLIRNPLVMYVSEMTLLASM